MAVLVTVAALAAIASQLVTASPLMDTLLLIPDLSTYAEVYNLTGGIVEINPLFLKRYNYDEDKRNYTFLAPTNDVSVLFTLSIYPSQDVNLIERIGMGQDSQRHFRYPYDPTSLPLNRGPPAHTHHRGWSHGF